MLQKFDYLGLSENKVAPHPIDWNLIVDIKRDIDSYLILHFERDPNITILDLHPILSHKRSLWSRCLVYYPHCWYINPAFWTLIYALLMLIIDGFIWFWTLNPIWSCRLQCCCLCLSDTYPASCLMFKSLKQNCSWFHGHFPMFGPGHPQCSPPYMEHMGYNIYPPFFFTGKKTQWFPQFTPSPVVITTPRSRSRHGHARPGRMARRCGFLRRPAELRSRKFWGFNYTRWCPPSYKLVYNPSNYRYIYHKSWLLEL